MTILLALSHLMVTCNVLLSHMANETGKAQGLIYALEESDFETTSVSFQIPWL